MIAFEKIENGKPSFNEKHLFMVSPLKQYVMGDEIVYKFSSPFLFEETQERNMIHLTANFDTNSDFVLIENGSIMTNEITVPYNEEGIKTLTFTATFSNGNTLTTQSVIHVKLAQPSPGPMIEDGSIWGNIPYQGFNESAAYIGKLDYRIFYHTTMETSLFYSNQ
jgi:hypothetical protein